MIHETACNSAVSSSCRRIGYSTVDSFSCKELSYSLFFPVDQKRKGLLRLHLSYLSLSLPQFKHQQESGHRLDDGPSSSSSFILSLITHTMPHCHNRAKERLHDMSVVIRAWLLDASEQEKLSLPPNLLFFSWFLTVLCERKPVSWETSCLRNPYISTASQTSFLSDCHDDCDACLLLHLIPGSHGNIHKQEEGVKWMKGWLGDFYRINQLLCLCLCDNLSLSYSLLHTLLLLIRRRQQQLREEHST